jgi:hypothetical protein
MTPLGTSLAAIADRLLFNLVSVLRLIRRNDCHVNGEKFWLRLVLNLSHVHLLVPVGKLIILNGVDLLVVVTFSLRLNFEQRSIRKWQI